MADLISLAQVTLGTGVATALLASTGRPRTPEGVYVQAANANTVAINVGGSDVTATKGVELVAGERIFLPLTDASTVYGFCATAGQKFSGVIV